MSSALSQTSATNPDLSRVDYAIWGRAGASLPWQEVWHRWSVEAGDRRCWSDAHCHGASLLTTSDNGTSFVVDHNNCGHIEHTFHCMCLKIIVVTDVVLKYFLEYSTTFFANFQPGSDVLIYVAPLVSYIFCCCSILPINSRFPSSLTPSWSVLCQHL